ncbi:PilW family protein [Acidihalobacter ferrooxydans]|uniref:Uncharacterized protein n=1 Tax=Acidihalobacter ferrooxydans TaxID=1765967 RepID=A0A1P8UJV3_9GAMM|nr:prepilin-type N-terminal cleavage/methylation domain-containing protein [Acidihalobacter ferrooxydans]APZ44106.1 hypothetical protein BW247_14215 [Acidihalobacter ferrooxydans]
MMLAHTPGRRQRGLGLIELMVALVISLFLLAGLFTLFYGMKRSYNDAQGLAGLQDNEVLAASVLANTLHVAGYFPYNTTYTSRSTAFPANTTWAAGQIITVGTGMQTLPSGNTTTFNTISLRLIPTADALDCLGNPGTGTAVETDVLSLINTSASPYSLACSADGAAAQAIVSPLGTTGFNPNGAGLANLQVLRVGVASSGGASVNEYFLPANMTTTTWPDARTLTVQLTFFNPLFDKAHTPNTQNTDNQGQPRYLSITRVISLENLAP